MRVFIYCLTDLHVDVYKQSTVMCKTGKLVTPHNKPLFTPSTSLKKHRLALKQF